MCGGAEAEYEIQHSFWCNVPDLRLGAIRQRLSIRSPWRSIRGAREESRCDADLPQVDWDRMVRRDTDLHHPTRVDQLGIILSAHMDPLDCIWNMGDGDGVTMVG